MKKLIVFFALIMGFVMFAACSESAGDVNMEANIETAVFKESSDMPPIAEELTGQIYLYDGMVNNESIYF